jgi:cell division protein FtsI/penicillin-binding protein 2
VNRPIRKVAAALAVLFAALFVNLNIVQVAEGNHYRNDPANRRVLLDEYSRPRGAIVVQGKPIAESKKTDDELKYLRVYPQGAMYGPVTGFYSYVYGSSGIEDIEDSLLSGRDTRLFTSQLTRLLTGREPNGGSVELTLNRAAQTAAYNAMKDDNGHIRRGAVVALDPKTGQILALVSTPSFDPNVLSSHDSDAISHAWACYSGLDTSTQGRSAAEVTARIQAQLALREGGTIKYAALHRKNPSLYPLSYEDDYSGFGAHGCGSWKDENGHVHPGVPNNPTSLFAQNPQDPGPLYDRALRQVYAAGSVFKVLVAAQALKEGYQPDKRVPAPNSYWPGDPQNKAACPASTDSPCVSNFDRETCQNGTTATLQYAFAKSCNTAFAELLTDRLNIDQFTDELKKFGLAAPYSGDSIDPCNPTAFDTPLSVCTSTPGSSADFGNPDTLARIAFGQQNVRITPMQAAMIASAVANNGILMKPYLVQAEYGPTGVDQIKHNNPQQLSQVLDPDLDAKLIQLMVGVVNDPEGTGHAAQINDVTVGGKTGTADTGFFTDGTTVWAGGCPSSARKCLATPPHAWFSGFAIQDGEPKIAVAVIIENGGVAGNETTGGKAAGPIAKDVMTAYLTSIGVR